MLRKTVMRRAQRKNLPSDVAVGCFSAQDLFRVVWLLVVVLAIICTSLTVKANPESKLSIKGSELIANIETMLKSPTPSLERLNTKIEELDDLQDDANDCVTKSGEQIKIIDELLSTADVVIPAHSATEGQQYLGEKKKKYVEQLTECRLLIFRIKESLPTFKEQLQKLSQSKKLLRNIPFWNAWSEVVGPVQFIDKIKPTLNNAAKVAGSVSLALSILIGIAISGLRKYSVNFSRIKYSHLRILAFYFLISFGVIVHNFIPMNYEDDPSYVFYRMIFVSIVMLSFMWMVLPVFRLKWTKKRVVNLLVKGLKWPLFAMLAFLIVIEWLGYYELFLYFSTATIWSILVVSGFMAAMWLINFIVVRFSDLDYSLAVKAHYYLGVRLNRTIHELNIIKMAFQIVLIYFSITLLMTIWGVPILYTDQMMEIFLSGFTVSNIKVVPSRIIYALLSFSVLSLIVRSISSYVAHQFRRSSEKDTQVAMASILGYIFFSIAVLVGFIVAGVNFTGLAIIAGALSVGIGFGLQNIVNNFICGVILLIQKPVKPGDRVIIGEAEGFVRRIRILSTQINTVTKEDIIIPNSDLIAHPITNYMFRDKFWRVTCAVGVKYGTDISLVKKLLNQVGQENPDVLKEEPNAPLVLFKAFGDSALEFELWCIIKDVNKKYHVKSDLNTAIDALFKEHGVVIAFPQRDIHIVESVNTEWSGRQ